MDDSSDTRDVLLNQLADEFAARHRAGERPGLQEYCDRHPDLADDIRSLFPALVELERAKADVGPELAVADAPPVSQLGDFRLVREIGRGGMGIVYEAVQESLGRHVALKLMPIETLADPKRLERFRREAKAAAKLHHTNIVPVFGTGEAEGRHYYAMQYIAGHPLDAVIDEVRRLKEKSAVAAPPRAVSEVAAALMTDTFAAAPDPEMTATAPHAGSAPLALSGSSPALSGSLSDGGRHYWATVTRVGEQVAEALAYAHGQGILHRDIKPSNLLLDLRGTVWVTDFGLAKSNDTDDLTQAGDFVGTLRYMAPERFEGQGDHRADVYALGLTLYELLTLKPAFAAENRAKLVEQVIAAAPPSPRSINPAIPRDLETIVLKAIQRDPAMRYQSATELADDLRRFTEDRPIFARRASSAEQAWRWCRRNPAIASLITAIVVVSVIGATVASLIARQQQQTANELGQTLSERDKAATELASSLDEVRRQADFTRRLLYVSHINQAQAALNDNRIPRLVELLGETTPQPGESDLRGWEWHHLNRLLQPDREVNFTDPGERTQSLSDSATAASARAANGGITLSQDGERVCIRRVTTDGLYYEVKETLTGKQVRRIPASGVLPDTRDIAAGLTPQPGELFDPVRITVPSILFSVDRRYVLIYRYADDRPMNGGRTLDPDRSRIWNLETGDEIRLPAELAEVTTAQSIVLGPDAAWLAWIKPPGDTVSFGNVFTTKGPLEVVSCRWERATNQITRSSFTIGNDAGRPVLSRDGRTVYWQVITRAGGFAAGGPKSGFGTISPDGGPKTGPNFTPWFECWDVSGPKPIARFKPYRLPSLYGPDGRSPFNTNSLGLYVFSPSGTLMAYPTATELITYRVSDGVEHTRLPLTGVSTPSQGPGVGNANRQFWVSDDGNRAVIRTPNVFDVVEKNGPRVVTRQIRFVEPEIPRSQDLLTKLLPDGRTVVQLTSATQVVQAWDVSRDPSPFVLDSPRVFPIERDGQTVEQVRTSDGRITVEYPAIPREGGRSPIHRGPFVVRDGGGKELGRTPDLGSIQMVSADSLNGGRRLLLNYTVVQEMIPPPLPVGGIDPRGGGGAGPVPESMLAKWALFDLNNGFVKVDSGPGTVTPVQGVPYLLESDHLRMGAFGFGRNGNFPQLAQVILRDARTGEVFRRIGEPNRAVRFCGFDPTGRTYLVESSEPPTSQLVNTPQQYSR